MFTELFSGLRGLRRSLTLGYSTLFTTWLFARRSLPTRAELPDGSILADLAHIYYDELGNSGQLGLVTFVSAMLGSFLGNTLGRYPDQVIDSILSRLGALPPWDEYIREAMDDLGAAGSSQFRIKDGSGQGSIAAYGRSWLARSWLEERERMKADYEFRRTLMWSSFVPAVVLACSERGWWCFAVTPSVLLLLDAVTVGWRVRRWKSASDLDDWVHQVVHNRNLSSEEKLEFAKKALKSWGDDEQSHHDHTKAQVIQRKAELEQENQA